MNKTVHIGVDVGSTTVKIAIIDSENNILYKKYERHYSDIKSSVIKLFEEAYLQFKDSFITVMITGSGGMGIAEALDIEFIQEVVASTTTVETFIPDADVVIELGGEDAKITYFGESIEQRMNGTCAGGTGSFIDQMASLLKTDAGGLNELANKSKTIYPIASRCGVFAKSDIQPLLNEGASKEDIAVSVLQAVVNQTISGLACGKPIRGNIIFLGGPLYFISELRERFKDTLRDNKGEFIFPPNAHYFVALGAAINSVKQSSFPFEALYNRLNQIHKMGGDNSDKRLIPLFDSKYEFDLFEQRHNRARVERVDISTYSGDAYLGIDAGSTTTKIALISDKRELIYSYYGSNEGKSLQKVIDQIKILKSQLNDRIKIKGSCVTGYGEGLIKSALKVDIGEVETVAHYKAADFFLPGVDFVIDIGGQDMKSLRIKDGVIESIMLNEACSSGCGSFIETFAKSVNMDVRDFAKKGLESRNPVDLGTRCTVFMNSRVKQAQKEGATVGDVSAGIAMSVIKNALFKVIRMRTVDDLGTKVVVQGGTFYNNAVLRAFELISGREVIRPDIAGIMGAFGAAIIAQERAVQGKESSFMIGDELNNFTFSSYMKRCTFCGNQCHLTVNKFSDGREHVTGNRCERGAKLSRVETEFKLPNMYEYKYKRLFSYKPLDTEKAHRGVVGIPRVLNMYEDYPLWFTFFTELGFRVVHSTRSSKKVYELGMETIPSESVCYPAKLAHGHIVDLINKKVDIIWYPCISHNHKEDQGANNHYNCPIVASYPETLYANVDELRNGDVKIYKPFLPVFHKKKVVDRLYEELSDLKLSKSEIKKAMKKAYIEYENFMIDIRKKGEEFLKITREKNKRAIILAGRVYHVDPEINHGIAELINEMGFTVLTEDSVAHLGVIERPIRVVDQWTYHNRLYRAAFFAAKQKDVELIQLNSFGCGIDAVTTDQVKEILERHNKIYTVLKIDEISNLGAVRIRVRSLVAAINERSLKGIYPKKLFGINERVVFSKDMKTKHTILSPQMSPIHFQFFEIACRVQGYNVEVLPAVDKEAIDEGLKYVNNDACYPSILVVGQVMHAINSGKYDLNNTSVIITQTGGGCRATNYIAFIRKALQDSGNSHIPVISLSAGGIEKNPGFKLSLGMINRLLIALLYGDLLEQLLYRVRPYEKVAGSANALYDKWCKIIKDSLYGRAFVRDFRKNIRIITREFDELPINDVVKPKVGIVGEILVKFHPTANNNLVELIESEGAEAVVPDLLGFFLYSAYNSVISHKILAGSRLGRDVSTLFINYIEYYRRPMKRVLEKSKRFSPPHRIENMAKKASKHLSVGNKMGEGWFLTAEMIELIESGVNNIACIQPFACLPNHVTGKGMIKELKRSYPHSNIVAIDYDPGASEVNQINRIKLMLSAAHKNILNSDAHVKK